MAETKAAPVLREKCGTYTGYHYHHRNKETPCEECYAARREQAKQTYEANKEAANRRSMSWAKRNPDKISKYQRTYTLSHMDKKRAKDRKRKALKLNNGHEPYTEAQVFEAYGTNCYLCDMPINLLAPRNANGFNWRSGLHIDHFVPLSLGGPDKLDNVRPSHAWCNMSKTNKLVGTANGRD